ncbi:DUF6236 family protein [Photobacterium sp. OFAV2-7]|uniref:DUF6236 family protein n=1 Tax=Photobacterium sp. OFAV2-7 TaxID=2917748 RepID=UPI001EF46A10|nr:DUF6236 family protein [Photobacterium sp. OFAV2-7]MCG7584854.1 DUF6236 family protein [Photobacterium sp. OFAV2-7]
MFNKTLYYPWIDIHDDSWVKTAILYWDEINTIVPYSMANPYQSEVANLLTRERILRPFEVTPSSREVKEASDIAIQYLGSPEGLRILNSGGERHRLHPNKMSYILKSKLGIDQARIHSGKMTEQLMDTIGSARIDDDGFITTDGKFSAYYMSALANRVAKNNNLSTVADSKVYNQFNTRLSADGYIPKRSRTFIRCPDCREQFDRFTQEMIKNTGQCPSCLSDIFYLNEQPEYGGRQFNAEPRNLVDSMLADIVIQSIYIPNTVDIDKLLKFRQQHLDELTSFRGALQDITRTILDCGEVDDIRALRQQVTVAYKDKVQPEIKCLKSQLKGNKIKYLLSDFSISGMASLVGTTLGTSIGTVPLLIAAGASIGVSSIMYRNSRNNIRNNPYSYVLSMEKKLT